MRGNGAGGVCVLMMSLLYHQTVLHLNMGGEGRRGHVLVDMTPLAVCLCTRSLKIPHQLNTTTMNCSLRCPNSQMSEYPGPSGRLGTKRI